MPIVEPVNKPKLLKEMKENPGFAAYLRRPGGFLDKHQQIVQKSTKSNGQKKSSSSSDSIVDVDDSTDVFYTSPTKK